MNLRTFAAVVLALGVLIASPLAQVTTLPLEDVRPGMVAVGRTVFSGTKLEDFKVEILGVMRNVIGPKRNLILARLEGGPLAKTGAIAGITPIDEMVDATMMAGVTRVTRPVAISLQPTPRELLDIWSRDLGR